MENYCFFYKQCRDGFFALPPAHRFYGTYVVNVVKMKDVIFCDLNLHYG